MNQSRDEVSHRLLTFWYNNNDNTYDIIIRYFMQPIKLECYF